MILLVANSEIKKSRWEAGRQTYVWIAEQPIGSLACTRTRMEHKSLRSGGYEHCTSSGWLLVSTMRIPGSKMQVA
jgi:hypothetical protein